MQNIENNQNQKSYFDSDEFFFSSLELESEWKKSLLKPTDKELVSFFHPDKDVILKNISRLKKEYKKLANEIKNDLFGIPEKDQWFYDIIFEKLRIPKLLEVENRIFQLKRHLAILEGPTKKSFVLYENFQEMIQIAKSKSITELARDKLELKPSGRNFLAICPFHSDTRPSLYFYTETNTFICFSCLTKGDVIKFNQLINGVNFSESVRMLQ